MFFSFLSFFFLFSFPFPCHCDLRVIGVTVSCNRTLEFHSFLHPGHPAPPLLFPVTPVLSRWPHCSALLFVGCGRTVVLSPQGLARKGCCVRVGLAVSPLVSHLNHVSSPECQNLWSDPEPQSLNGKAVSSHDHGPAKGSFSCIFQTTVISTSQSFYHLVFRTKLLFLFSVSENKIVFASNRNCGDTEHPVFTACRQRELKTKGTLGCSGSRVYVFVRDVQFGEPSQFLCCRRVIREVSCFLRAWQLEAPGAKRRLRFRASQKNQRRRRDCLEGIPSLCLKQW